MSEPISTKAVARQLASEFSDSFGLLIKELIAIQESGNALWANNHASLILSKLSLHMLHRFQYAVSKEELELAKTAYFAPAVKVMESLYNKVMDTFTACDKSKIAFPFTNNSNIPIFANNCEILQKHNSYAADRWEFTLGQLCQAIEAVDIERYINGNRRIMGVAQ